MTEAAPSETSNCDGVQVPLFRCLTLNARNYYRSTGTVGPPGKKLRSRRAQAAGRIRREIKWRKGKEVRRGRPREEKGNARRRPPSPGHGQSSSECARVPSLVRSCRVASRRSRSARARVRDKWRMVGGRIRELTKTPVRSLSRLSRYARAERRRNVASAGGRRVRPRATDLSPLRRPNLPARSLFSSLFFASFPSSSLPAASWRPCSLSPR